MSAVRLLPWVVHHAIEYLVGLFFLLAPFIFEFTGETPFPVFVAVGVVILAVAILSKGALGVVSIIPTGAHATLDYLLGMVLIALPFVFAFTELQVAMYISVLLGVAHLVITLITRFPIAAPAPAPEPEPGAPPTHDGDKT